MPKSLSPFFNVALRDENSGDMVSILLDWYEKNKRDLPWRGERDPYRVWVSEIILQQTRVAQGWAYYERFIGRFPTVKALAEASEEEVLLVWQGLGYYSRARNMHHAARDIMHRFAGEFPTRHKDILSLKGIGEYTAAAIASIAFGAPFAAVDGNVLRVIARLFAVTAPIHSSKAKRTVAEISSSLLPIERAGDYNQAVMDFGSLVCTPSQPACTACPLREFCMAYALGKVSELPVTQKKRALRSRYFHYFFIVHGDTTYLVRREKEDIWKNLYEFPLVETPEGCDEKELVKHPSFQALFDGVTTLPMGSPVVFKHILSHQRIHAYFYRVDFTGEEGFWPTENLLPIPLSQMDRYPLSQLTRKYLKSLERSCRELQNNA